MVSKRELDEGQRWFRELATEAEKRYNYVKWDKKQCEAKREATYHQGFLKGQAEAYSRAADLLAEYFPVTDCRQPQEKVTPRGIGY